MKSKTANQAFKAFQAEDGSKREPHPVCKLSATRAKNLPELTYL